MPHLSFEEGVFLNVYGRLKFLYICKGYDELYKDIQALWKTDGANKVVLVGNAGTGKSWYQLYILRRLLKRSTDYQNDADDYDFVFHQVRHQHYLIDIKDCVVYQVNSLDVDLLAFLAHSLYFFEPRTEKELELTIVGLPSLATLSPYGKQISEYHKYDTMLLYFWPWSFTEMCAIVELLVSVSTSHLMVSMTGTFYMAELSATLWHQLSCKNKSKGSRCSFGKFGFEYIAEEGCQCRS